MSRYSFEPADRSCFTGDCVSRSMSTPDESVKDTLSHTAAATAFVQEIESQDIQGVESVFLFGSTARGEATGLDSDVDFLAVIADEVNEQTVKDQLRDAAYDVMLEYGPVVEVHVLTRSTFDQRRSHPFVNRAVREGEAYV